MLRPTVLASLVTLMFVCFAQSKSFVEDNVSARDTDKLDGVYEFVSESVVLTEPKKTSYKRASPEWGGIWQFQKGYFTSVLMKGRRDNFFDPKKLEDFGFESSTGPYEIQGKSISLIQTYTFHPFEVDRSILVDYRFKGNTLILTQTLQPYVEDLRKGTITTVLRRLK